MCCIFTLFGWTIDFFQRVWVFIMSGIISTAVCCGLSIAIASGVALGYNYSLAEYVDLKATNITLYVRRGVYNDDPGFNRGRRSGGDGLDTGPNQPLEGETTPAISGRRLDDSLINDPLIDQRKYEDSLMRLTVTPLDFVNTKSSGETMTTDDKMQVAFSQFPEGSLDQLKAIQGIINMRKEEALRATTVKGIEKSTYPEDFEFLNHARRMMAMNQPGQGLFGHGSVPSDINLRGPPDINPARYAVPDASIIEKGNWMGPQHPGLRKSMDYHEIPTFAPAIRYQAGPIRPTRPVDLVPTPTPTPDEQPVKNELNESSTMTLGNKLSDLGIDDLNGKLILDKYEDSYRKDFRVKDQKSEKQNEGSLQPEIDYYDEEIKGVPARRKRNINRIKRKVLKPLHQKIQLHESISDNGRERNSVTDENTNSNVMVSKLLRFDKASSRESLKSDINDVRKNVYSTTDRIVRIIQSMFS